MILEAGKGEIGFDGEHDIVRELVVAAGMNAADEAVHVKCVGGRRSRSYHEQFTLVVLLAAPASTGMHAEIRGRSS